MRLRTAIALLAGLEALASACARPAAPAGARSGIGSGAESGSVSGSASGAGLDHGSSTPTGAGAGLGSASNAGRAPEPGAASPVLFDAPVPPAVDTALAALQKSLATRLQAALAQGGPVQALVVCHTEAPSLTLAAQIPGIALGRTSHRLRNPANAPPAWAADAVAAAATLPPGAAKTQTVALANGKIGLLRPIPTAPMCVACHGEPAALQPELRAALADRYPADQATGFAAGSLRGWFWAEWTAQAPDAEPPGSITP